MGTSRADLSLRARQWSSRSSKDFAAERLGVDYRVLNIKRRLIALRAIEPASFTARPR